MHFSDKELRCRCGYCGMLPRAEFRALLERIREDYGEPIVVTSGARCPTYNRKIGGARRSAHCEGIAADLLRTEELLAFLMANLDKYNIWLEDPNRTASWLHVDTRYRPVGRVFQP